MATVDRPVEFGFFPEPLAQNASAIVEHVLLAEQLGFELIGIQDHPYQPRYLDTWALLAHLAARTERIRLFPDVANLPLRLPAMIAKSAASIDVLSGGRIELGLGAGAFWDAIVAMGGPRRTPPEALQALEEAIAICRLMWSGERSVRFEGRHHAVRGLHPGPSPAHAMSIWIGGYGPRMLDLIGRTADGWLPSSPYAPPERLPELNARIDDGAASAGRDPASIRRIYNVAGQIQATSDGYLRGPPEQWIEQLTSTAVDGRMDAFIVWAPDPVSDHLRRFAAEIAPAVRQAVAGARR